MLSQTQRYCYVCELGVKTLYNHFPPPPILDLFQTFSELLQGGTDLYRDYGERRVSLSEISIENGKIAALFRLTDPDIPDNILENQNTQELRVAEREDDEVPARSAHIVINADAAYNPAAAYPLVIENVDGLSRSLISALLNHLLGEHFTDERPKDDSGELRTYSPRVEVRGHQSQTLASVLNGGGNLHGVKLVTNKVQEDAFGDAAYSVTKSQEINMKVTGKPSGNRAINFIREKVNEYLDQGLDKAKVVIEDPSGRVKTSPIDIAMEDIAQNFFILQSRLFGFDEPLLVCEAQIRADVVEKMTQALPD